MVETDLSFTHYLPNAHADEDFLVTALTHRGELWLVDNMDTTSNAPERQEFIPAGVGGQPRGIRPVARQGKD